MEKLIREGIVEIIEKHERLLQIPVKQKAKFEGWLKLEIANHLEKIGAENVEVESIATYRRDRYDISFFYSNEPYRIELKTPNTNWEINGINSSSRPITQNIQSIIDDAEKLNSKSGIVAFVLFPIPENDDRWVKYLNRISENTGIELSKEENCGIVKLELGETNTCELVVCTFKSRKIRKRLF